MKFQLIPDWRESWRYYSRIGIAILGMVSGMSAVFVDSLLAAKLVLWCSFGIAGLTGLGSVIEQSGFKPVVKHGSADPVV